MSNDLERLIRESLRRRAESVWPPEPGARRAGSWRWERPGRRIAAAIVALGLAAGGFALVLVALGPNKVPTATNQPATRDASVVRAEVGATIPTQGEAVSVSSGPLGVWLAIPERDPAAPCSGAIERIDPATNTVTDTFDIDGTPTAIMDDADLVWVAAQSCVAGELPSLLALAPSDGHVIASVKLPVTNGVAFDLDESEGTIWMAIADVNTDRGAVLGIDEATREVVHNFPVDGRLRDISVTQSGIWVIDDMFQRTALIHLDEANGSSARLFDGRVDVRSRFALAGAPAGVWVSLGTEGASLVDQDGTTVTGPYVVPGGFGPFAADEAGVWFWGLDMTSNEQVIGWLDAPTGDVRVGVPLPDAPTAAAVDANSVWVALSGGGVSRVDFETRAVGDDGAEP